MRFTELLAASLLACTAHVAAQTVVSSAVYTQLSRYNNFASAAYADADACPQPPFGSTIVKTFNNSASDTQALLYRNAAASELVLAFRGTSTPVDIDTDFAFSLVDLTVSGQTCSGCKVHQGFQASYKSIANDVVSTISAQQAQNPGYKLIVTGHSLGGGLASIAASALVSAGKTVTAYTYGEPRNGNPAFTAYINRQIPNYFRATNGNDGVPQIPPTLLGFQHHGTEYWFSRTSGNTAATTFQCPGTEPRTCNGGQDYGTNPINRAHIVYNNVLVGNSLFNQACGYRFP